MPSVADMFFFLFFVYFWSSPLHTSLCKWKTAASGVDPRAAESSVSLWLPTLDVSNPYTLVVGLAESDLLYPARNKNRSSWRLRFV